MRWFALTGGALASALALSALAAGPADGAVRTLRDGSGRTITIDMRAGGPGSSLGVPASGAAA